MSLSRVEGKGVVEKLREWENLFESEASFLPVGQNAVFEVKVGILPFAGLVDP